MLYSRASGAGQPPPLQAPTITQMSPDKGPAADSPRGRKRSPLAHGGATQPILLDGRAVTAVELVAIVREQRRFIDAMEASTTPNGVAAQLRRQREELELALSQEREARARREAELREELELASKELDIWRKIPSAAPAQAAGDPHVARQLDEVRVELERVKGELRAAQSHLKEAKADVATIQRSEDGPRGGGAKQPEMLDMISRCSVQEICLRETEALVQELRGQLARKENECVRLEESASAKPAPVAGPEPSIVDELRAKLKLAEEECASLGSEREQLREEAVAAQAKRAALEEELRTLHDETAASQAKRATIEEELHSLQEHGRALIVEIADSEASARKVEADLKSQNDVMRAELNTAVGALEQQSKDWKEQWRALGKRLKVAEAELERVRSEKAALQGEVEELKQGLSHLSETDAERLKELAEEVAIAQERAEKAERQVTEAIAQATQQRLRIEELEQQAAVAASASKVAGERDAAAEGLSSETEEALRERLAKFEEIAKGFAGGIDEIVWCRERAEMLTDELENSVSMMADQELQIRALELRLEELGDPDAAVIKESAPEEGGSREGGPGAGDAQALQKENDDLREQIKNISAQRAELARTASVFAQHAEELSQEVRGKSKIVDQSLDQLGVMDDVIDNLIHGAEHAQDTLNQALSVTLNISITC